MLLLLCVSIYAFHTLTKWQISLSRSTRTHYLVFWLLWFVGMFTIRFVGSPPFLLILSGQVKYFFLFHLKEQANQTKKKKKVQIKQLKKKTNYHV